MGGERGGGGDFFWSSALRLRRPVNAAAKLFVFYRVISIPFWGCPLLSVTAVCWLPVRVMNMDGVIILELSRVSVTAFGFAPVLRVTTFLPELMWLTLSASTTSLKLTEVFSFYLNFSGILSQGSVNRCKRNSLL